MGKWNTALPALALGAGVLGSWATPALAQQAEAAQDAARRSALMDTSTCSRPEWPQEAIDRGTQGGTSTILLQIDTDGSVVQSSVRKSSGDAALDEAARAAIAKCRFRPAVSAVSGAPQRAWVPVQYVWTR